MVAHLWVYIPWSWHPLMASALAFLWLDVFRIRRDVIDQNLRQALPHLTAQERQVIARSSMRSLCRSFFDVMKIPFLTDKWIVDSVQFENPAAIEKMKNQQGGFFVLTLHMGSGDLAAALISKKIKPLALISKRFRNGFLDAFWFGLRAFTETQFIDAHAKNNAFDILAALKKNRGVVFVLDQYMGKPYGLETEFFGIKTGTAYGLALFAKKTGKPIYPVYTYWDSQQQLKVCIEEPIDLTTELSETNEVLTNKFNAVLEKIIRAHPEHWMWVHKRWKIFE